MDREAPRDGPLDGSLGDVTVAPEPAPYVEAPIELAVLAPLNDGAEGVDANAADASTPAEDPSSRFPGDWLPPAVGRITSRFGDNREGSPHRAIDIAGDMGTEVVAPTDLVVSTIAYSARAGRYLVADVPAALGADQDGAADTWRLTFAHLSHTAVFEGDRVKKGEKLALIGVSGTASGPHLHFRIERVTRDGVREAIDPLTVFHEAQIAGVTTAAAPTHEEEGRQSWRSSTHVP